MNPIRVLANNFDFVLAAWEETENEIRHRLKDPDLFDECRSKDITDGIRIIYCHNKTTDKWEAQAIRFDKNKFSISEAKKWMEEHKKAFSAEQINVSELEPCQAVVLGNDNSLHWQATEISKKGLVWDVVIMKVGFAPASKNLYITKESLYASVNAFEGARLYANENADWFGHKTDPSKKGAREIVGFLKNVRVEGDALLATVHLLPSADWLRNNLMYLEKENQLDIYQLSFDATVEVEPEKLIPEVNKKAYVLKRIVVGDVDIVPRGAAGGKFLKLVASKNNNHNNINGGNMKLKEKLIKLFMLAYPSYAIKANVDWLQTPENELYTHLLTANKLQPQFALPEIYEEQTVEVAIDKALASIAEQKKETKTEDTIQSALMPVLEQMKAMQISACELKLKSALMESNLPQATQDVIAAKFAGKIFTDAELKDEIETARRIIAPFTSPENKVSIKAGMDSLEKFQCALDGLFLTSSERIAPLRPGTDEYRNTLKGIDPFRSIREAYIVFTGDEKITGRVRDTKRFLGSIDSTQFSIVCENAMNKALIADYNKSDLLAQVEMIAKFTDLNSIQQQERIRYGGYAEPDIVGEGQPYLNADTPSDEKAYYSPEKRGCLEDITLEAIKKDDVGAITQIPARVARACIRGLYKNVFDLVNPAVNGVIYDGKALYVSDHANYGTAALGADGTALWAAVKRMAKQKEANSDEPLNIRVGYLLVPIDLAQTADQLTRTAYGQYNSDPSYLQKLGITPIIVSYWTDTDNWACVARREDGQGIEVGFVDGQRTPEIFVADVPNSGSLFTHDKITYKWRFWYGYVLTDYRFFDGSIVAS